MDSVSPESDARSKSSESGKLWDSLLVDVVEPLPMLVNQPSNMNCVVRLVLIHPDPPELRSVVPSVRMSPFSHLSFAVLASQTYTLLPRRLAILSAASHSTNRSRFSLSAVAALTSSRATESMKIASASRQWRGQKSRIFCSFFAMAAK